ncbi:MAG: sigma-70 family RNA polymerase sigma factor, partial [Pseudomonadales bacterium]|nr:sigma-70 family RNA polymerase sigma factor [Pseudomonadales bacterium]
ESVNKRVDEEYLVLKAQAGSEKAFSILFRSYNPSLLRSAFRLCRNEQMALDAVQDAWLTISRTLGALTKPAMFRARVFKAVRWRTIDLMRKRDNNLETLDEDVLDESAEDQSWATTNQIVSMVERLPEVERQAIYLFYLEEMSIKELAKVFDVPTGTVKSRLNRARTRLKKLVGDTE